MAFQNFSNTMPNPCNPCQYFNAIGASVSRWCPSGDPTNEFARYAYLTQTDTLVTTANGNVEFDGASLLSDGFTVSGGSLQILQSGTYQVTYTINLPNAAVTSGTAAIEVGGVAIAGTQVSLTHTATEGATSVTANAIFQVTAAATLSLVTSAALTLTAQHAGDTMATMTVVMLAE